MLIAYMGSSGKNLLGNNNMRSGSKDGNGGNDGEGSEGDEAQPVQHLQDCSHDQLHIIGRSVKPWRL